MSKEREVRNIVSEVIWGWESARVSWRGDQIPGLHNLLRESTRIRFCGPMTGKSSSD